MSYDKKCWDLAEIFLKDDGFTHTGDIDALAQQIQDTIEDFIKGLTHTT